MLFLCVFVVVVSCLFVLLFVGLENSVISQAALWFSRVPAVVALPDMSQ